MERATGIAARHITDFYPSVDDARSRLQWATTRFTTRPEDISYSLFGIFGLYGESAANALGRLLAEVIARSGDTMVLGCFPATIVPYQILPSQLPFPDLTAPPTIFRVWKILTPRSVRKMHQALSSLPLTQFLNFRLILPCIVHRIKTILQTTHVHRIQARGLDPIKIVLTQPLENISNEVVPPILIRPWHSKLLDASVMLDDASAYRWLTRMKQPFSALLLKELPHNEFKRVASSCHILARPTDSAGVLKGEVTMLTIV